MAFFPWAYQVDYPNFDSIPRISNISPRVPLSQTAFINIRIFDGENIGSIQTVVITSDKITYIGPSPTLPFPASTTVIDGSNNILFPGFIDTHLHLSDPDQLLKLARHGVTTAFDMCTFPAEMVESLRERVSKGGVCDFRTAGLAGCGEGSKHAMMDGMPPEAIIRNPEEARTFVQTQLAKGASYIKYISDGLPGPGLSQETMNALVDEATKRQKLTIAHAFSPPAYIQALQAKTSIITHIPPAHLPQSVFTAMQSNSTICIPALTMIQSTFHSLSPPNPPLSYNECENSIKKMLESGVKVLVGTDSNTVRGAPVCIEHGKSLVDEMELLLGCGMGLREVIRGATCEAAHVFGLGDRGGVEVGMRADLVMVEGGEGFWGDTERALESLRRARGVWCAGIRVGMED